MTDRYQAIRDALEAGPTPGPWLRHKNHLFVTDAEKGSSRVAICKVEVNTVNDWGRKNKAFISSCDPDTIRALLEERDRFLDALESIEVFGGDTLSGRADGPDDRKWQRDSVREMRNMAREAARSALTQGRKS